MWLKVVIVFLFIALLVSLFTGLAFLFKEKGQGRGQWNSLAVRLGIATLLMGFLIYGIATGQLGSNAPWDPGPGATPQSIP